MVLALMSKRVYDVGIGIDAKRQYYGHHHQNCAYDIVKLMHCLNNDYLWILNLSYLNEKGKDHLVLIKMCKRAWYGVSIRLLDLRLG
jgi:hypothetical protein